MCIKGGNVKSDELLHLAGHLPVSYRELQRQLRSLATTYLSYSSDGRYLLANLGGENVYLYDTTASVSPVKFTLPNKTSNGNLLLPLPFVL